MTREPTPEQLAAIGTRAPEVLLEAGAGTGKTGVLVERYCDLIEPRASPPRRSSPSPSPTAPAPSCASGSGPS